MQTTNKLNKNLNEWFPEEGGDVEHYFEDYATFSGDNSFNKGPMTCVFRNLEEHLVGCIKKADAVVGCVAWLTHPKILDALATIPVNILVQKEDFLRPDLDKNDSYKQALRRKYDALRPFRWQGWSCDGMLPYNVCGTVDEDPVRCVGNWNKDKNPAFPRMHNKFLVFLRKEEKIYYEGMEISGKDVNSQEIFYDPALIDKEQVLVPCAVWTGSFNFTLNGGYSLENALIIEDRDIAERYAREWNFILGLSEKLDWTKEWSSPDLRIGS